MKRVGLVIAGLTVAVIQSAVADVTVPHIFQPGETARAAHVNENFDSLLSATNDLTERVGEIEAETGAEAPDTFSVEQSKVPVGSTVFVGGKEYTIVQFEVPRHDQDTTYLLRFPTSADVLGEGTSHEQVFVRGAYPDDPTTIIGALKTELNGFNTAISESMDFISRLRTSDDGSFVENTFLQRLSATIMLGPDTRVSLHFSSRAEPETGEGSNRTADTSTLASVMPPVRNQTDRDLHREQLRELLTYVWLEEAF